jgi:hypothetical protein
MPGACSEPKSDSRSAVTAIGESTRDRHRETSADRPTASALREISEGDPAGGDRRVAYFLPHLMGCTRPCGHGSGLCLVAQLIGASGP